MCELLPELVLLINKAGYKGVIMETKKIWLDVVQAQQPAKWQVVTQLIIGVFFATLGLISIIIGRRDFINYAYFVIGILTVPVCLVSFWRPRLFFFNQPAFVEFHPQHLAVKQRFLARTRFILWSRITGVYFKPGQVLIHVQEEKTPIHLRPFSYKVHMELRDFFMQATREKGIALKDWQVIEK